LGAKRRGYEREGTEQEQAAGDDARESLHNRI
jgi:hypothetical protein